jgi:hypothetical protein
VVVGATVVVAGAVVVGGGATVVVGAAVVVKHGGSAGMVHGSGIRSCFPLQVFPTKVTKQSVSSDYQTRPGLLRNRAFTAAFNPALISHVAAEDTVTQGGCIPAGAYCRAIIEQSPALRCSVPDESAIRGRKRTEVTNGPAICHTIRVGDVGGEHNVRSIEGSVIGNRGSI